MIRMHDEAKGAVVAPGVERRVLARGGALMMVEVSFAAGAEVPEHSHVHEQASYVSRGEYPALAAHAELDAPPGHVASLSGERRILAAGDSFYAAPGVPHAVRVIEAAVVVDGFTPQREDFLS